ncbi:MAG: hypothetical protein ACREFG_00295, partial [Chthoniobacterales bacterium]
HPWSRQGNPSLVREQVVGGMMKKPDKPPDIFRPVNSDQGRVGTIVRSRLTAMKRKSPRLIAGAASVCEWAIADRVDSKSADHFLPGRQPDGAFGTEDERWPQR